MKKRNGDSGVRPAALLLAAECPYPLAGGGALRTAALAQYLAKHYDLDIAVFRQQGAPDPKSLLPPGLVRDLHVIPLPFHARGWLARSARNLRRLAQGAPPLTDRFGGFAQDLERFLAGRRYELAVVEHFWCAAYVEQLAPVAARVVLDLHNIESILHGWCAESEPWPASWAHRRFRAACRGLERRWLPRFSRLLVVSARDRELVREILPGARVDVYPNTIPRVALPAREPRESIVFSGNLEYHPNVTAVRFFRREIWPLLRDQWPQLTWELVGRNPEAVRKLVGDDPRIRLTGPVEDAVATLAGAKVAIVPLLAASGTRVKILEAWAAGVPVVSTSLGAEGLPCRQGEHLLVADRAQPFADSVSLLLTSTELGAELRQAGRELYEREFTWEAGWERLAEAGL